MLPTRWTGLVKGESFASERCVRAPSAAAAALVPAVLQRLSDSPCVGQGLAANEVCPENREHSAAADPRRIAPSLRPDLISDKDNPRDANYACALSSAGRGDDAFPISHLW